MSATTRPAHGPGSLRDALLTHAVEMLEASGPDAITVRGVAELAGRSQQAVYTAFGDRAKLMKAVISAGHTHLAQYMFECPTTKNPVYDLFAQIDAYLSWVREHPRWYLLLSSNDPTAKHPGDDRPRLTYGPVEGILKQTIERVIKNAAIRSPDVSYLYLQIAAGIHGAALINIELAARGQGTPDNTLGLELAANLLIALGHDRSTTLRTALRAQR